MKSKQALVPKLRFGELQGEWLVHRLGEICSTFQSGKGITSSQIKDSDTYPVFGGNGLRGYTDTFTHEGFYFLIGRQGALCGNINRTTQKCYVSEHAIAVQGGNLTDTEWLAQRLDYYNLNRLSESSAQPGLSAEKLKRLKLATPSLPEQEKIAAFLTSVDDRIDQLKRKKSLLQDYKKGAMQKLFSQELRFKDEQGKDFPDWEEKKLGEVAHNVGYGLNASAVKFDGIHKYIRITDIDEDSRSFAPKPITSPESYNDDYLLKDGDLVFARTGASVGKSYLHTVKNDQVYFAGFLIRFSINQSIAYPAFIFMQTLTQNYAKWVKVMSMRSGQPGINAEEYKSFSIPLPTIPEQTKIANFLSSLDQKIEQVDTQITQTQTFKKGLLQQMFV